MAGVGDGEMPLPRESAPPPPRPPESSGNKWLPVSIPGPSSMDRALCSLQGSPRNLNLGKSWAGFLRALTSGRLPKEAVTQKSEPILRA